MSRTVLVKPLASMLRIYPNIYEPGVTCEEVAPHTPSHTVSTSPQTLHARYQAQPTLRELITSLTVGQLCCSCLRGCLGQGCWELGHNNCSHQTWSV